MIESDVSEEFHYRSSKPRRREPWLLRLVRILGRIILLLAVFEGGWLLIANLTAKPVVAQWSSIEKGCWTDALFLRAESVLTAPGAGRFILRVPLGVRVPRGEILAVIKPNPDSAGEGTDPNVLPSENLDSFQKIQQLTRDNDQLQVDLDRITGQIEKQLTARQQTTALKSPEELASLLKEKTRILRTIQNNETQIKQVQNAGITPSGNSLWLTAPHAGYWFPNCDGWEDRLDPGSFTKLSGDDFRINYPLKRPGKMVATGDLCGKVIDPFSQLIVVAVDPRQTGYPHKDTDWKIVFQNNPTMVTVQETSRLRDGRLMVALEDQTMKLIQPERKLQVYLIYQRTSGISLPVQALYRKGRSSCVRIIKGVGYRTKKVEVVASNGERAIVKGIDSGTVVLSR